MTMGDDIITKLRENADLDSAEHVPHEVVQMQYDAANYIERLLEQIDNLTQMHKYAVSCEERITKSYLNAVDQHNKTLDELAALEVQNEKLKIAIKTVVDDADECTDNDGWAAMLLSLEAYHIASVCLDEINELPDNSTQNEQLAALAEQNENLTKERDRLQRLCIERSHELAAIAVQNEKLREALEKISCNLGSGKLRSISENIADDALALPDLSTPVLNRIKAEGMRVAAEICDSIENKSDALNESIEDSEGKLSEYVIGKAVAASSIAKAIRARADELEKTCSTFA